MDYICPANLFSISSCDLNTKFNDRSQADWSRTNLISFVTLDGIFIIQPQLEQLEAPFGVELIKNLTAKFKHAPFEKNNPSFDCLLQSLDNHQYMAAYLDPAILANFPKIPNDNYQRHYRTAKWSPVIDVFPKQCLLAVLTVDFQLLLFAKKQGIWTITHDLSRAYDELWMQTPILSETLHDSTFDGMRRSLHSLSFGAMCWKETREYPKAKRQYLVATTLTGELVIWRLTVTAEHAINFDIKMIIRTNQQHVDAMQFIKYLCIVTTKNGQVNLYDLNAIFDELNAQDVQQPNTTTPPKKTSKNRVQSTAIYDLAPTAILWHQDNIEVADFYFQTLSVDTFRMVLAKGTNICWCTIHYKPRTETEPATLAISDSFSAVDGSDPEVSLHQAPATWMKQAGERKAVLIANDGSFFRLEFVEERQDTSPSFNSIATGKVDLIDMFPRGLCTSPNGHLITMISSVTFLVDPLKIPASAKLILLPTVNEGKFFNDCFRYLLDENWLVANDVQSPMDVRDLIDSVVSTFHLLNHHQYLRLHSLLEDELRAEVQAKNGGHRIKMKIISLIISKLVGTEGPNKAEGDSSTGQENSFYGQILLENIEQILSSCLELSQPGAARKRLTDQQVNSVRNCMSWLDKSLAGQQIRDKYKTKIDSMISTDYKQVPYEVCSICQCDIPFETYGHGTCTNKHLFNRCSRSLLVLEYHKKDRLCCVDCGRSYLDELVWPTSNLWLCLYCQ